MNRIDPTETGSGILLSVELEAINEDVRYTIDEW